MAAYVDSPSPKYTTSPWDALKWSFVFAVDLDPEVVYAIESRAVEYLILLSVVEMYCFDNYKCVICTT